MRSRAWRIAVGTSPSGKVCVYQLRVEPLLRHQRGGVMRLAICNTGPRRSISQALGCGATSMTIMTMPLMTTTGTI
jgi:hypothetical protein